MKTNKDIVEGFNSIFNNSNLNYVGLDLSNSSIIDIIKEQIKVKEVLSPLYGKRYSSLFHNLLKLQNEFSCTIMPYQITDVFWSNFIPYLIKQKLALSTIKTLISQLKTSLEWGSKHGAIITPTYDSVVTSPYHLKHISLTPDEVSSIYHFNVNDIPKRSQYRRKMQRIKDMFVLSCNLGQRYSDMIRIDCTNFNRNLFTIVQQKTGGTAVVDIDRYSLSSRTTYDILKKYKYTAPYLVDLSEYDKALKRLLQHIGGTFNDDVKIEERIGGKINTTIYKRWKLVTSHTARRTFITYNYLRGINLFELKKATGHKTNSSLETYLCPYN